MSEKELQDDEREALSSIYDGDNAYKQISPTTFQYKYGETDNIKSFLLEISWGESYPNEKPTINLDTFYNRNLLKSIKDKIRHTLEEEAEQWLGSGMTYTLFECLKENLTELLADQTAAEQPIPDVQPLLIEDNDNENEGAKKAPARREQLTKAQKRRAWDRAAGGGTAGCGRARGWDWVDLVKHLSQVPHVSVNASHDTPNPTAVSNS